MSALRRHCRHPARACRAFCNVAQYPGSIPGAIARLSGLACFVALVQALGG